MISELVLDVVGAGLIVSACLAIFLDEAVYAVAALAATFILTAIMYWLSDAPYVAVFQFAVGIGTLAILFLSGEMLSEKPIEKTKSSKSALVVVAGVILSLPSILFSISSPNEANYSVAFGDALWNYRALDVVLQGLVIMMVALGVGIILYQQKKRDKEKRKGA